MSTLPQRNRRAAMGLVLFMLASGSMPLFYTLRLQRQQHPLTTSKTALRSQDVIRGAFANSGSKDVGPDPDWDFKARTWRGKPVTSKPAARADSPS